MQNEIKKPCLRQLVAAKTRTSITRLILCLATLSTLQACGKARTTPPGVKQPLKTAFGFRATTIAMPAPNQYEVQLNWNRVPGADTCFVHREVWKGLLRMAPNQKRDGTATFFSDQDVQAGQRYVYLLECRGKSGFRARERVEVTVPKDFDAKGILHNPKITGVKRLFLHERTRLITDGKDLHIDVDEIISNYGNIESFPKGQINRAAGRSGGTIIIRARRASGRLVIWGRGEDGSPGYPGGDSAKIHATIDDAVHFSLSAVTEPGKGSTKDGTATVAKEHPFYLRLGKTTETNCCSAIKESANE